MPFLTTPSKIATSFTMTLALLATLTAGCMVGTDDSCADGACASEPVAEAEQAIGARDIGVIPNGTSCFSGSELITIHMDDEDTSNSNFHDGWHGGIVSGNNTTFRFCRADGNAFKPLSNGQPYAVLKLGTSCPAGGVEFIRMFDNEDTSNDNWHEGTISPSYQLTSRTALWFCLFRDGTGAPTMTSFPSLPGAFQYGVFAPPGSSRSLADGTVFTDDEDASNGNYYTAAPNDLGIIGTIISGGSNTTMHLAKVK